MPGGSVLWVQDRGAGGWGGGFFGGGGSVGGVGKGDILQGNELGVTFCGHHNKSNPHVQREQKPHQHLCLHRKGGERSTKNWGVRRDQENKQKKKKKKKKTGS